MPDEPVSSRELMARNYRHADTPTTCLLHAGAPLDERPDDCQNCHEDLRSGYTELLRVASWLQGWRDDALDVLTRQDAALMLLAGYEPRPWAVNEHLADIAAADLEGRTHVLAEELPTVQAQRLVEFFERVRDTAEGLLPVINVTTERRAHRRGEGETEWT